MEEHIAWFWGRISYEQYPNYAAVPFFLAKCSEYFSLTNECFRYHFLYNIPIPTGDVVMNSESYLITQESMQNKSQI